MGATVLPNVVELESHDVFLLGLFVGVVSVATALSHQLRAYPKNFAG
jgi:hypothetical protein